MWERFVAWLKCLFSSDDSPDSATTEEMTSVDKLDVVSCEVVSIAFEDDDDSEENSEESIPNFEI